MLVRGTPPDQLAAARALEEMARLRNPRPYEYEEKKIIRIRPTGRLLWPDFGPAGQEAAAILTEGLREAVGPLLALAARGPAEVRVAAGQTVEQGQVLVVIE